MPVACTDRFGLAEVFPLICGNVLRHSIDLSSLIPSPLLLWSTPNFPKKRGQEINVLLGLCPKQRTPPTHCAHLALSGGEITLKMTHTTI